MSEGITVFACDRGAKKKNTIKIQLEIPERILDGYKQKAKGTVYTPKQVMENMLTNWIDGVKASDGQ